MLAQALLASLLLTAPAAAHASTTASASPVPVGPVGVTDASAAPAPTTAAAAGPAVRGAVKAGGDAADDAAARSTGQTDATRLIKRFLQVDTHVYRGGQPDEQGLRALRDLGIKTIISLRTGESADAEAKMAAALGMTFVQIPIAQRPFGVTLPKEAIAKFFSIVDNPESGKVFLHCRRGADRTGTFVGLYRIARQGWDSGKAYDEARDIGMRWWYFPMKDQLKAFATTLASVGPASAANPAAAPAGTPALTPAPAPATGSAATSAGQP